LNSQIINDLKKKYPDEIVDALISSFNQIYENFIVEKFEPSELNGGKFTEAVVRILEFETNHGKYTPLGGKISNMKDLLDGFALVPKDQSIESFRVTIPRVLFGIYDIRNKRGVGHLGGDVNPNYQDCSYIVGVASWVMCELFRIIFSCSLSEAQSLVDSLINHPTKLIVNIDDVKRVLNPDLKLADQVLLVLYHENPSKYTVDELIKCIEPNDNNYFRNKIIGKLHKKRFIERNEYGECLILRPGISYVEKNIKKWKEDW